MPRSQDLDTVAPDDAISPPPPSTPAPPPKTSFLHRDFRSKVYEILGHTKSSFSSMLIRPHVFSFSEKDDEEEIILVLRAHWITNVSWILIATLMAFMPIFLKFVPLLNAFSPRYQIVAVVFWYLVTFAFAFEKFLSWYFNVYIITDERIIDIDFHNLLDKKFSEAKTSMIQDVTYSEIGISQTVFNYGNVLIQTAAEINQLEFERVPSPDKVVKVLQQLRQEEEQEALEGRIR